MYERNAVKGPERVIADRDESSFWQIVKNLLVVYTELYLQLLKQQTPCKLRSGGVATLAVNSVYFVYRQKVKKPVHQLLVSVKFRYYLADVIIVEHILPYLIVLRCQILDYHILHAG